MSDEKMLACEIAATLNTTIPVRAANPRRGAAYREAAINFSRHWPIGSNLTWEEFCQWAHERGLLEEAWPPVTDRNSMEWLAFLQRRHQARESLNKAASHPSLIPHGGAFFVAASGGGLWVRSTLQQIVGGKLIEKIGSLANTKREQLEHLIQSTDWTQLQPHLRLTVEDLNDDLDNWIERVGLDASHMEARMQKLSSRLRDLVAIGEVVPLNGGIAGLIGSDTPL